jgi:hypothetical protein
MQTRGSLRARLIATLPPERYRIICADGRPPSPGDVVLLDQGFKDSSGLPMVLVYFPGVGADSMYSAEVYESELE